MKVACIGSRDISHKLRSNLIEIGEYIASCGWTVVSGNAIGSDAAYAEGANKIDESKVELYLPWQTYNTSFIKPGNILKLFDSAWKEVAIKHHPIYASLSQGAQKMMDRNAGIIINSDVVLAVLNHSKTGGGGTGHGWRIAESLSKPRLDVSKIKSSNEAIHFLKQLNKVI